MTTTQPQDERSLNERINELEAMLAARDTMISEKDKALAYISRVAHGYWPADETTSTTSKTHRLWVIDQADKALALTRGDVANRIDQLEKVIEGGDNYEEREAALLKEGQSAVQAAISFYGHKPDDEDVFVAESQLMAWRNEAQAFLKKQGTQVPANAPITDDPFAAVGELIRVGTMRVEDEEVTGFLIQCERSVIQGIKHLPMYRRVQIVEVPHA